MSHSLIHNELPYNRCSFSFQFYVKAHMKKAHNYPQEKKCPNPCKQSLCRLFSCGFFFNYPFYIGCKIIWVLQTEADLTAMNPPCPLLFRALRIFFLRAQVLQSITFPRAHLLHQAWSFSI